MNQSITDDVEKGLDNLLNQIKKTTFDVLAILFKEEENVIVLHLNKFGLYLDAQLSFAQKIYFLWKASTQLDFVFTVFNYVNISTYLQSINYETYMASVYILVFVILLMKYSYRHPECYFQL